MLSAEATCKSHLHRSCKIATIFLVLTSWTGLYCLSVGVVRNAPLRRDQSWWRHIEVVMHLIRFEMIFWGWTRGNLWCSEFTSTTLQSSRRAKCATYDLQPHGYKIDERNIDQLGSAAASSPTKSCCSRIFFSRRPGHYVTNQLPLRCDRSKKRLLRATLKKSQKKNKKTTVCCQGDWPCVFSPVRYVSLTWKAASAEIYLHAAWMALWRHFFFFNPLC